MSVKKKLKPKKCEWRGCPRPAYTGHRHCHKHKHAAHKAAHPLRYSYQHLKYRALERGKEFTLTYEQYEAFAIKTNYAALKGKTGLSLSIDRKDDTQGYHHWNIRAITLRANSRRQFSNMPEWMKEEIKACEAGHVPDSHKDLHELDHSPS